MCLRHRRAVLTVLQHLGFVEPCGVTLASLCMQDCACDAGAPKFRELLQNFQNLWVHLYIYTQTGGLKKCTRVHLVHLGVEEENS